MNLLRNLLQVREKKEREVDVKKEMTRFSMSSSRLTKRVKDILSYIMMKRK